MKANIIKIYLNMFINFAIGLMKVRLNGIIYHLMRMLIELLKENRDKIDWKFFSVNPSIFEWL